jgi:SpoVK/Ycf46/Vps4 family AAA+-type ATPase
MDNDIKGKKVTHQRSPDFEGLARHIKPIATWENLSYPQGVLTDLRNICSIFKPGKGLICLFVGESGTCKTLAAEVIANQLHIDLCRIDLSVIVTKFIGETEKDLDLLFDRAEDRNCILFFDDADTLFGKRSNEKNNFDRYANIEITYLMQRMQAYPGLAILSINKKNAMDGKFLERFHCIIDFPDLQKRTMHK